MSIRNLDSLIDPASVAVIGASSRPGSLGAWVWHNLHAGGFSGPLWAVNPKYARLDGDPVFATVAALPQVPELAVICTPPGTVAQLVAELAEKGTRAAVVLSAGMTARQRQAMLDAAKPVLLRILGPNCIGLLSPPHKLNASFAHLQPLAGQLAFVSQSGALLTAVLDWAQGRGIGFSHVVSLGERADVDFGDMLDYLASDAHTRAILLYIESIESAPKFMSAARSAARNKPVIVVKSGRSAAGVAAAASHTGALAGADAVADAAFRRAGMLRVDSLQDLFTAAETLTRLRDLDAEAPLSIVTNGGGAGVMAADAAAHYGLPLARLDQGLLARLDAQLPANWSRGNPIDLIGDAPVARYVHALQTLLDDPATGNLLFIHAPTAIVSSAEIAQALLPLAGSQAGKKRMLASWLGEESVIKARQSFRAAGVATYDTPEDAVRAVHMLRTYSDNQTQLMQAPAATAVLQVDLPAAQQLLAQALSEGREMLAAHEALAVLAAYGIPVAAMRKVAAEPAAAAEAAAALGFPVVLKVLSEQISHKSDVGGVVLNLDDAAAVEQAATAMLARVQRLKPLAVVEGFAVQAMVLRPQSHELIVGASIDPTFGPVLLFGQGGTAVEVLADRAMALPPLNEPLARALVQRTRVARLLAGFRDTPAIDHAALYRVLMAVSQMLVDLPELAELDINPLLASAQGVLALDGRIRVSASRPAGAAHFAIKPYPAQLEQRVQWQGQPLLLRPIRPEDEAQHLAFLERLDPEDVRMRIFYSRRSIARSELARLTQIDYARETAFIATRQGEQGEETLGVARAMADPDNVNAEFGVIVRSDLKGQGLGRLLMDKLVLALRQQGTQKLVATVLQNNTRMLELGTALGLKLAEGQDEPGERRLEMVL